jgi:hypothetical protein
MKSSVIVRYILVDCQSNHVMADSAVDLDGSAIFRTAREFAKAFDESIGDFGRDYEELDCDPGRNETGYHVYVTDAGTDVLPVLWNVSDSVYIDLVRQICRYYGFILVRCGNGTHETDQSGGRH